MAAQLTPWHQVVQLREDVRTGELSLSTFAADLYDVVMGKARPVYQDPREFFALTYPTVALRDLARDVALRLAGQNDKAVRQLELTYGGGKTHTLITLYHLTRDPRHLPDLPSVKEFIQHIGMTPPQALIAVLPFDKLDVEKGMEIVGPQGERRWLKQPWSILAWQIAGADGLRVLHPDNRDEERASAPAENLLTELLAIPERQGLPTLILLDEILMYAREKVGQHRDWLGTLTNFFQYLTQAVAKTPRCAIVASLLATDPRKSDQLGKEIMLDLQQVFTRQQEAPIQPVQKDDAAEVLRRRFFTPESLRDRNAFRPHVVAAAQGIAALDEQSARDTKGLEAQLLQSYPFHPSLTDIFYTKWTNLEGFQRTRGVLRTFALALRDAERWDTAPLIGTNVFLSRPGETALSDGARELTTVAETEEYEGKRQAWTPILEGELGKARDIQQETTGLRHREVEQAVFATFLHSQPIGQKASTRDLMLLLGPTRPDKIDLEKALKEWVQSSWFLDESALGEGHTGALSAETLPRSWRLGSKPNLRQMHHDALDRINAETVNALLDQEIRRVPSFKAGFSAAGARLHTLPERPSDVEDDGAFHVAILGPTAASAPGHPSSEAVRFLTETTSGDRPRVYRNAVVLVVPSRDGLEAARNTIRDHLAWKEVEAQLKGQDVDPVRGATLASEISSTQKSIPERIRQAYCVVVTMSAKGEPEAFKITLGGDSLFTTIKADKQARITEAAINAEALLPGGPYDLWRADEPTRRVKDLVGAFAQYPKLPKMLNSQAVLDTLVAGCRDGIFVLQLPRPDRSYHTYWREEPPAEVLKDPALEAALPESATLTGITPALLAPGTPGALPGLWQRPQLRFADMEGYFSGQTVVQVDRGSYAEPLSIPRIPADTLAAEVRRAVAEGYLWLRSGPTSLYREEVPEGILTADAMLQGPPQPVLATSILAPKLPAAWSGSETSAAAIAEALASQAGQPLPWSTVRQAIQDAMIAGYLELGPGSGAWPCEVGGAALVRIMERGASHGATPSGTASPAATTEATPLPQPSPRPAGVLAGEADLRPNEIQDLAEQIGQLTHLATQARAELTFRLRVEVVGTSPVPQDVLAKLNSVLEEIKAGLKVR